MSAKTFWHCRARQVADRLNPSAKPRLIYYFIQLNPPEPSHPKITKGESALYSESAGNFVTTEDPQTALLILQLLNEGNLTLRDNLPEYI